MPASRKKQIKRSTKRTAKRSVKKARSGQKKRSVVGRKYRMDGSGRRYITLRSHAVWHNLRNFEDIVRANIQFLVNATMYKGRRGIAYEGIDNPISSGLNEEACYILVDLIRLCERCNVVSLDSQPAVPTYSGCKAQKGYVYGMWKGTVQDFARRLSETRLGWLVAQIADQTNVMKCPEYAHEEQIFTSPHSGANVRPASFPESEDYFVLSYAEGFDTPYYHVSEDPAIVFFEVWDPEFNLPTNHCAQALTQALM